MRQYCDWVMIIPSKHLLVLKTSWRHRQNMSWRRLQHVFSVTILRYPRRLEDVLKKFCKDILKGSCMKSWRPLEDILQDVLTTPWYSATCTWNKVLYKRAVLKNLSTFLDKYKEQSSGGFLSKDVLKKFVKFTEKTSLPESPLNKVAGWKP